MAKDPVEILRARNNAVETIRSNGDLTESAKQQRINEVSENAQVAYQEALEAQKAEREERLERTRAAIFRVPIPKNASDLERETLFTSYRSAANDVYNATLLADNPGEELERLLVQSERSGDELLARACFHRAVDLGIQPIVDAFLSARPMEEKKWTRYTEAHEEAQSASSFDGLLQRSLSDRAFANEA